MGKCDRIGEHEGVFVGLIECFSILILGLGRLFIVSVEIHRTVYQNQLCILFENVKVKIKP